ncbi:MAG: HlyD family efflux transporter periplasmic adaptor subunit [Acidobacteriota bacterium]
MDVPRKNASRKKLIKRIIYFVVAAAVIGGITFGVSRLKPAAPTVDAATMLMDTVKRGQMVRQVRGIGTLIPEEIRWIPALSDGRIEQLNVKPGAEVTPDTILVVLSNPDLEQSALEAGTQLKSAEADFASLKVRLERQVLDQKAQAATVQSDFSQAKMQAEVNESLYKQGLLSEIIWRTSKVRAEELATRNEIEEKRLAIFNDEVKTQLAAQESQLEQRRALYKLRQDQVGQLRVRAGIRGVVQVVQVQVGQQVTAGTNLARVADPSLLKAELKIAETQVKDIALEQLATIDTRNGVIQGKVSRIDPAAQNGTITVDVRLEGELPKGARPDISVEGTIELERLENILYVGRPVYGQERSTVGIFKLDPDGKNASRVQVRLGRSSVNTIEIIDGLKEGDRIILSDTASYDSVDRIRLN